MKHLRVLSIFVVFVGIFCFLSSVADAKTTAVDCGSNSAALVSAIGAAAGGDTLNVTGACTGYVAIGMPLTLNGGGTITTSAAQINANDTTQPAVKVTSGGVTINGFHIYGGKHGITVQNGAAAYIVNNIVENNANLGILVREGGSAHIGFLKNSDTAAPGNLIQNNGNGTLGNPGHGIVVMAGASARIAGNTITGNAGNGIAVDRVSQADIAGNLINSNHLNGIAVSGNSGVNLGMDNAGPPFDLPNYTDAASKNLGVGIACTLGGYVAGYKGFLAGVKGVLTMDPSCVNGIQTSPYSAVGTWNVVSADPSDATTPTQVTMNADGTGVARPQTGAARAFTWSLLGDQLTVIGPSTKTSKGPLIFQDKNNVTWTFKASTNPSQTVIWVLHRKGT